MQFHEYGDMGKKTLLVMHGMICDWRKFREILWKSSSSNSRSSAESPFAMISSLPVSLLSFIWPASVSFLHNLCGYAFRNTL